MNPGGEYLMEVDASSVEKRQTVVESQGQAALYGSLTPGHHYWPSTTSTALPRNLYRTDNGSTENGIPSNYSYESYDQQRETTASQDAHSGINAASHASTPSLGPSTTTHDYSGYASYPNSSDPYGYSTYGNSEYQNHYYGYQQPTNDSSHLQVGAGQNSGAPYQPLSSFQNASSYVGPTSYSGTYYNPGDYQTTAGYQSSGYDNQTNSWTDGNGGYPTRHQHYSNYAFSDTNATHSTSSAPGNSLHYQQQYDHWAGYYGQTASALTCTPGTETTSATATSTLECPVPGVSGGYSLANNQPPPPGTTSWRHNSSSSGLPSLQGKSESTGYSPHGCWVAGTPGLPNQLANQIPSYFQNPLDLVPPPDKCENQQQIVYSQGPSLQFSSSNHVIQNFQPPLQTVPTLDTHRVSKIQIPTNPRIASNLALGMQKTDSSTNDVAPKPAYISVSLPKLNNNISSHDSSEGIMKHGTFPPSLRAYVERSFARCKDDTQRVANQTIMKEIVTKASADGTLFTRNWDIEPLFSLPNTVLDTVDKNNIENSAPVSPLPKYKRSPSRRTKSRWEPIPEEKMIEKVASVNQVSVKDSSWDRFKEADRAATFLQVDNVNFEGKENGWNSMKFLSSQQQTVSNKNVQRPFKKPRFGDISTAENGDASSDSDKEHSLTKYYSSAVALENSPEERKRREHRSKRFEKGQERQADIKYFRPKNVGAGNSYSRRVGALLHAKNYGDGGSRAVEDIDWDALTVKGTCQEIEKRYLRLTSAPDPASVRPEEVLEKALSMVQSSPKNYLYKCDQLKSIRQDLTVQRIHNELTVKVYETHARLALEAGDLPEYNQCQSQLKNLYAEGIKGCHLEFSAYNLLCVILHSSNNRELLSSMARLTDEAKVDEAVKHALAVRAAVTSGNYILFFRLYKTAPNLSTCLMDLYVERIRFEAVKCMSKSFRPTIPVTYVAQVLGFSRVASSSEESDEKDLDGLEECEDWLRSHGASLTVDNNGERQIDAKATSSSLYMPEPDDAVSHGDTNLAVNDFLTRAS